jgi:hypothetical protein
MIGLTNSGKSFCSEDITQIKGIFNTQERKETSFRMHYKITDSDELNPYKITEYY